MKNYRGLISLFFYSFIIKTQVDKWNKSYFLSFIASHIIDYPTAMNLNYAWSFGSAAGICLVIQMVSGILLAMHYTPDTNFAFISVEHIMRDINNGWLLRYCHSNGASMFFIVVYCHIFRGMYFGSYLYPRATLWFSGIVIFLLMMATAFIGYVLPWGQMSLWGATVITNLFSAIPIFGKAIVEWLWGGFCVDNATITRFYSLHYLMPFVIAGCTVLHLSLLHKNGSNNPLGINIKKTKSIRFYPYFYVKDLFFFFILLFTLLFFVLFFPNVLGHSDNYIPANPLITPAHIVPEFYFLAFYAILRAIPSKLGGVIAMIGALLIWFILPIVNVSYVRSSVFRPLFQLLNWILLADFLILGWLGQKPVESPYTELAQVFTLFYFIFFIVLIPGSSFLENRFVDNKNVISLVKKKVF